MKTMKKAITFTLVFLMLISTTALAEETVADTSFRVFFDGQEITFPDEQTYVHNGKYLYIPLRAIAEATGYEVSWEDASKTAIVKKGDRIGTFTVGGKMYVNDVEKQAKVNFPLKNGRIFVSQYGICHALDCTMRWDSINSILYFYSSEMYPLGIDFSQETFKDPVTSSEEYKDFYSLAEPAFIIPGLNEGMVPNGIAYCKNTDRFFLSYKTTATERAASIATVDAKTGELIGEYRILDEDGSPSYAQIGGIAVSEKDIYFHPGGAKVKRIPLAAFDAAGKKGTVQVVQTLNLEIGGAKTGSYVDCSGGYLWFGNFYDADKKTYAHKALEKFPAVIRGYKLDSSSPDGIAEECKATNSDKYEYIPNIIYTVDDTHIQGVTTTGNYMLTTTSYSTTEPGIVHVYDMTKNDSVEDILTFDENRQVPVIHLTPEKNFVTPPYLEEIAINNEQLYMNFESGAIAMRVNKGAFPTDSVWKIDVEKLVAPSSK